MPRRLAIWFLKIAYAPLAAAVGARASCVGRANGRSIHSHPKPSPKRKVCHQACSERLRVFSKRAAFRSKALRNYKIPQQSKGPALLRAHTKRRTGPRVIRPIFMLRRKARHRHLLYGLHTADSEGKTDPPLVQTGTAWDGSARVFFLKSSCMPAPEG